MVGASREDNRPGTVTLVILDFGHHIAGAGAMKIGPRRKGSHPGIAGIQARAFSGKISVGSAGAHDDPMGVITGLLGKLESSVKGRSGFEFERVSTMGLIDGGLKIIAGMNRANLAGRWSIRQSALHLDPRQLRRPVEPTGLSCRRRLCPLRQRGWNKDDDKTQGKDKRECDRVHRKHAM